MISDPRRCHFEPATLLCKPGAAAGSCLSQVQIDAANRIYQGAHKSDGTALFQGFARGSELKWPNMWASKTPGDNVVLMVSVPVPAFLSVDEPMMVPPPKV